MFSNRSFLFVAAVSALVCAAAVTTSPEFESWMAAHHKVYSTDSEKARRFANFQRASAEVRRLNREPSGASFRLNKYADLDPSEHQRLHSVRRGVRGSMWSKVPVMELPRATGMKLPVNFSWVEQGAVTPVKDQARCGSCWTFGTTGTAEGAWYLHSGKHELVSFSEQQIVDCDHSCMYCEILGEQLCNEGCNGGWEVVAFNHLVKNGGLMREEDYPYKGKDMECKFESRKAYKFSNWTYVVVKPEHEDDLREYLYKQGPVDIGVYADTWPYYSGGVFDNSCKTENDHAVLLVGWGEANGKPYWLIKNSWGEDWGEKGYIRLARGKNKCGMLELMAMVFV